MNGKWLLVAAGILFLFIRAKKSPVMPTNTAGGFRKPSDDEIKDVLSDIYQRLGYDTAVNVEKIYRAETTHFTSGQYNKSGSPGMLKHKVDFPFGWDVMESIWADPQYRPIGDVTMNVRGKDYTYLVFPDFKAAANSLAAYLQNYPPERWVGTDKDLQANYLHLLNGIVPRFVNQIVPVA